MKPLARPVLKRWGFRRVLAANGVLAALGVAAGAAFSPAWPLAALFAALALGGLFRSLQFTAMNTLAFAEVPRERLSAATSFYGTAQQLPPALGVVLATGVIEGSRHLAGRETLLTTDFTTAFLVAGLVVLAAAPLALRLPRDAGAEVSGHR
jgi:MFS family permease